MIGSHYSNAGGQGKNVLQLVMDKPKQETVGALMLAAVKAINPNYPTTKNLKEADDKVFKGINFPTSMYPNVRVMSQNQFINDESLPCTSVPVLLPAEVMDVFKNELVERKGQEVATAVVDMMRPDAYISPDPMRPVSIPSVKGTCQVVDPWRANWSCWSEANVLERVAQGGSPAEIKTMVVLWSSFYCMTDGRLTGFYARLDLQEGLAARLRTSFPPEQRLRVGLSGLNYRSRLQKRMPLLDVNRNVADELVATFADPVALAGSRFYRVNGISDAGIAWRFSNDSFKKVTRSTTMINDLLTSVQMTGAMFDFSRREMVTFLQAGALNIGKPKFEVVQASKVMSKVRSIKVANAYNQIPLALVCKAFSPAMKTVRNDGIQASCGNMYGFTPLLGGMNSFIKDLFHTAAVARKASASSKNSPDAPPSHQRFTGLYYSDNVYLFDNVFKSWFSLDVAKMESSSTVPEARESTRFITDTLGFGGDHANAVDMINVMGSEVAHNVWCVRDSWFFKASGLSTGTPNTFLQNHTRMAAAMEEMMFCFEQDPQILHTAVRNFVKGDDPTVVFPDGAIVPFDLEVTAADHSPKVGLPFLGTEHEAKIHYPTFVALRDAVAFKPGSYGTMEEVGPICRLDILGFDATMVLDLPGGAAFVGCLSWERVWKTICFRRTEMERKTTVTGPRRSELTLKSIDFVSLLMLQWVGGFAYADTLTQITAVGMFVGIGIHDLVTLLLKSNKTEDVEAIKEVVREHLKDELAGFLAEGDDVEEAEGLLKSSASLVEMIITQLGVLFNGDVSADVKLDQLMQIFSRHTALTKLHSMTQPPIFNDLKDKEVGRIRQRAYQQAVHHDFSAVENLSELIDDEPQGGLEESN